MAALLGSARGATETEMISRAIRREQGAIRAIIKQHNRRLYRLARGVLRDDSDAEDAVQEAYVRAFAALATFRGDSNLATWLSRIVLNESFQKLRRRSREPSAVDISERAFAAQVIPFPNSTNHPTDPERDMAQRELFRLVEQEVDKLPDDFRLVLVARTIEGMSIEETAELLDLKPETVKTRLFRARRLLKIALSEHVSSLFTDAFPFDGRRCERMADAVVKRLTLNT